MASSETNQQLPILHVIVVGFHHKKGCQVEYAYPPLIPGEGVDSSLCPRPWKHLPSLALPDGSHNYLQDTIFFHLPSLEEPHNTIYGVSCYRQIDASELLSKNEEVTRNTVQKSVCVLSRLPVYGLIQVKLELITQAYFRERDFSQKDLLQETFSNLNCSLLESLNHETNYCLGLSSREVLKSLRHKMLVLFKLMMLEKKVLYSSSPVSTISPVILTIVSMFPEMIETGLDTAATYIPASMSPSPTNQNKNLSFKLEDPSNTSIDSGVSGSEGGNGGSMVSNVDGGNGGEKKVRGVGDEVCVVRKEIRSKRKNSRMREAVVLDDCVINEHHRSKSLGKIEPIKNKSTSRVFFRFSSAKSNEIVKNPVSRSPSIGNYDDEDHGSAFDITPVHKRTPVYPIKRRNHSHNQSRSSMSSCCSNDLLLPDPTPLQITPLTTSLPAPPATPLPIAHTTSKKNSISYKDIDDYINESHNSTSMRRSLNENMFKSTFYVQSPTANDNKNNNNDNSNNIKKNNNNNNNDDNSTNNNNNNNNYNNTNNDKENDASSEDGDARRGSYIFSSITSQISKTVTKLISSVSVDEDDDDDAHKTTDADGVNVEASPAKNAFGFINSMEKPSGLLNSLFRSISKNNDADNINDKSAERNKNNNDNFYGAFITDGNDDLFNDDEVLWIERERKLILKESDEDTDNKDKTHNIDNGNFIKGRSNSSVCTDSIVHNSSKNKNRQRNSYHSDKGISLKDITLSYDNSNHSSTHNGAEESSTSLNNTSDKVTQHVISSQPTNQTNNALSSSLDGLSENNSDVDNKNAKITAIHERGETVVGDEVDNDDGVQVVDNNSHGKLIPLQILPEQSTQLNLEHQISPQQEDASAQQVAQQPYTQLSNEKPYFGFPLEIFKNGSLCHPYLSLHLYDMLKSPQVRAFTIGATNALFKQRKQLLDVIVELSPSVQVDIVNQDLKKVLTLSKLDNRFVDSMLKQVDNSNSDPFLDNTSWEGSDDWVRGQFRSYLISLLATVAMGDDRAQDDFNRYFIAAWKTTDNYKSWMRKPPHTGLINIPPEHYFKVHEVKMMTNVRMKFNQVMGSKDSKRINTVVNSTEKVVSNTGRAVGNAVGFARSTVTNWFSSFGATKEQE